MAGRALRGGRHPRHDRGHPRGDATTSCAALGRGPPRARRCAAGITHLEIKSGYGLDVETERALLRGRRRADRRRDLPRRARRARRVRGPRRRLRRAGLRRDARAPARRTRAGSTCSASAARSTPTSRAPCSRPVAPPGSGCACTATSSGPARACGSRSSWARPRSTTAPTSTDADVDALAGERHGRHVPARHRLLDPPALPRRAPRDRRRRRASRSRRTATPGSSYTTSMALLHRARGARHAHDRRGGAAAATLGGARALRRDDVGRLAPGARADARRARRAVVHAPRLPPRRAARRSDRDPRESRVSKFGVWPARAPGDWAVPLPSVIRQQEEEKSVARGRLLPALPPADRAPGRGATGRRSRSAARTAGCSSASAARRPTPVGRARRARQRRRRLRARGQARRRRRRRRAKDEVCAGDPRRWPRTAGQRPERLLMVDYQQRAADDDEPARAERRVRRLRQLEARPPRRRRVGLDASAPAPPRRRGR